MYPRDQTLHPSTRPSLLAKAKIQSDLYLRLLQQEPLKRIRQCVHHVHRHREPLIQVEEVFLGEARVKLGPPETCSQAEGRSYVT